MKDPYEVLEIKQGSSSEEIKIAYKKLVKKYHPDQYANHPLADLAEEKMKEINQAYDSLTKAGEVTYGNQNTNYSRESKKQSRGPQYSQSQNQKQSNGQTGRKFNIYNEIRRNVEIDNLRIAEQMLDNITNRNAEWNYLKGIISQRKGGYDQALRYLTVATNLDPHNIEYRAAYSSFNSRNNSYKSRGDYRGYSGGETFCILCSRVLMSEDCMGFSMKRKC